MVEISEPIIESAKRTSEISAKILSLYEHPSLAIIRELFNIIIEEINSTKPNIKALTSAFPHFQKICQDFLDSCNAARIGSEDIDELKRLGEAIVSIGEMNTDLADRFATRLKELKASATLAQPAEQKIDNPPAKADDEPMSATTDKDYIDAKLLAITAQLVGDIKAANAATDGRLALIEKSIDGKLEAIGHQLAAQVADMKAAASARGTDNVKWMAGTMITLAALSMAYMTFLVNNASPKAPATAPAPIIIYAQPAPTAVAAPTVAPSAAAVKRP